MTGDRDYLVDAIYETPVEIAEALGYDRLTELHNGWIRSMVFGDGDMTVQGHRGSFKTTCLILAFAFIIVLFPEQRTIFLRKTDADVAEVMAATARILQTAYFSAISETLYGIPLKVTNATQTAVDTSLSDGVSGAAQLVGLGCGASITGKHADRVFTDDIVNVRDRVSAAERERIKLIYQELQNIKNRGGRIFNTGTPWHKDDAFQLMPNIERFDCYSTGLMTPDEIEHVRKSMTRSLFAANYELKHVADEDAMFSEPEYFADVSLIHDGMAHIDAAYGGEDYTALTILKERKGTLYAHGRVWHKAVDAVLPEILATVDRLRAGTIWCESNADKGFLRREILKTGHPCATYAESMNKYIKIATYLKKAWPRVRMLDAPGEPMDADYVAQVLDYSEFAAHDDAPDSLASAIRQLGRKASVQGFREGV